MSGLKFKEFPLSITDNNLTNFKIYPNPVENNLFISKEKITIQNIIVYSTSGKLVIKQSKPQNNTIDVSILPKGMYFIEINSDEGKTVKKFVKK